MKRQKLIFKKNTLLELNDKSLFQINGGTLSANQEIDSLEPKPSNTSVSGPSCTMDMNR